LEPLLERISTRLYLPILKITASVFTIAFGPNSVLKLYIVNGYTGLDVAGPRCVSEIHAVTGGAFFGLELAPPAPGSSSGVSNPGRAYFVIAAVRILSLLIDRSAMSSYITSAVC
jgi:hypothetical protein